VVSYSAKRNHSAVYKVHTPTNALFIKLDKVLNLQFVFGFQPQTTSYSYSSCHPHEHKIAALMYVAKCLIGLRKTVVIMLVKTVLIHMQVPDIPRNETVTSFNIYALIISIR